jgi:hypothetical protein
VIRHHPKKDINAGPARRKPKKSAKISPIQHRQTLVLCFDIPFLVSLRSKYAPSSKTVRSDQHQYHVRLHDETKTIPKS